jgi:hypothetical protein
MLFVIVAMINAVTAAQVAILAEPARRLQRVIEADPPEPTEPQTAHALVWNSYFDMMRTDS